MRTFRILLSLLLCLTVPTAGWASVLSGPAPATVAHHHCVGKPAHHRAAPVAVAAGDATTAHQFSHRHPAGAMFGAHDGSCKGGHCSCGCGMGACTAPALSLSAALPVLLLFNARDAAVNFAGVPLHGFARGTLPLRPPIS